MISTRAQKNFDQMLTLGIKASLGGSASDLCEVEPVATLKDITESHAVMITVASFLFRLSVLIYFSPDEATRRHFVGVEGDDPTTKDDQAFFDAIRESCNVCCGSLNRELATVFPHVAMSTPNIIERECGSHLETLKGGYLQHFRATTGAGSQFYVTLCVRDYAAVDFEWTMPEEAESSGELEFF
ncbi:MAG: hypothetical protein IPN06_02090 [Burkholderiales bacterium]|nr:hypothetical protein [Burkholderiales bacterium]